ncbi:MAG: hypothetical protein ABH864_02250 [archaeon]
MGSEESYSGKARRGVPPVPRPVDPVEKAVRDAERPPFELQWRRNPGRMYIDCKGASRYEDIQCGGCK